MNTTAWAWGLYNTRFTNPNSFDNDYHKTTVTDLAALAERAMQKSMFRSIVSTRSVTVIGTYATSTRSHTDDNTNDLLSDSAVIGVKTGTSTEAGQCLVVAAEHNGLALLTVVLGSEDRCADTRKLLNYGWDLLVAHDDTTSYAAGDFDGDGYDDLAVGIPQATAAGVSGAGKARC